MTADPPPTAAAGGFALRGELTFATVPGLLKTSARALAEGPRELQLDLSGVTRTDSAGLALLVGMIRQARQRQGSIRYAGAPAQLLALARANKLDGLLGLSS